MTTIIGENCIVTSPVGAAAKYCDEYVCVCVSVCLSVRQDICGTTRAIFTKFIVPVVYVRVSVLLQQLTIGRIAYRQEGDDGSAQR